MKRRSFLKYIGAGACTIFSPEMGFSPQLGVAADSSRRATENLSEVSGGFPTWLPVSYPVPLGTAFSKIKKRFSVKDQLILPKDYEYEVVAAWGDRFGPKNDPTRQITFGYNCDFTALIPKKGGSSDEFWLVVNHEYVSAIPWMQTYHNVMGERLPALKYVADRTARGFLKGRLRLGRRLAGRTPLRPGAPRMESEGDRQFRVAHSGTWREGSR